MAFELGAYGSADPSTYKHSNGTVLINNHSNPVVHGVVVTGQSTATDGIRNLTVDGANTIMSTYQNANATYIYNDMVVTNGNVKVNGATNEMTVRGVCTVNGGNMFNTGTTPTGAHS